MGVSNHEKKNSDFAKKNTSLCQTSRPESFVLQITSGDKISEARVNYTNGSAFPFWPLTMPPMSLVTQPP